MLPENRPPINVGRRRPPTLLLAPVRLSVPVGLQTIKTVAEEIPVLIPTLLAERPEIEDRRQEREAGEKKTRHPVEDETQSFEPGLQNTLTPEQHPNGDDQEQRAEPTPSRIRGSKHDPSIAKRGAGPKSKIAIQRVFSAPDRHQKKPLQATPDCLG